MVGSVLEWRMLDGDIAFLNEFAGPGDLLVISGPCVNRHLIPTPCTLPNPGELFAKDTIGGCPENLGIPLAWAIIRLLLHPVGRFGTLTLPLLSMVCWAKSAATFSAGSHIRGEFCCRVSVR